MNVVIEEEKKKTKLTIFYVAIILVCIIAIIASVILQINEEKKTENANKIPTLTADQITKQKAHFNTIFENKVNYLENNSYKITKIKHNEEIVYLQYENNESKINDYELNVNIPYINIDNSIVEEFNTQINDIFEKKAKSILNTKSNNIIYTVDYSAYVSNNILSVIVRSTLKEGSNPQRDIIQTYNYDLENQKKCTIDDMLNLKGITKKEANQKIKQEIKIEQEKAEELVKLGYSTYLRDYTSDMYSINNVTEYFIGENNALYIIYAYGNENNTNEMDIIIM